MLARLDGELAPARSQADRQGGYLRVVGVPEDSADVVARVREIVRELGHEVEPLGPGEPVPEDWYDLEGVRELSAHEADTIAETWLGDFAREMGLEAAKERALKDVSRRALARIFDRWHAERKAPEPGEALEELRAAAGEVLTPSQLEALGAWLAAKVASLGSS